MSTGSETLAEKLRVLRASARCLFVDFRVNRKKIVSREVRRKKRKGENLIVLFKRSREEWPPTPAVAAIASGAPEGDADCADRGAVLLMLAARVPRIERKTSDPPATAGMR